MSPATATMPRTDDADISFLDLAPYLSESPSFAARNQLPAAFLIDQARDRIGEIGQNQGPSQRETFECIIVMRKRASTLPRIRRAFGTKSDEGFGTSRARPGRSRAAHGVTPIGQRSGRSRHGSDKGGFAVVGVPDMEFAGDALPLSRERLTAAADLVGGDVNALWAAITVETLGCGFLPDRRPRILFERHIFSTRTNRHFDASHPHISGSPGRRGRGTPIRTAAHRDVLRPACRVGERILRPRAGHGIQRRTGGLPQR
jgi:hypothetical protein